jgi:hypothetical protein
MGVGVDEVGADVVFDDLGHQPGHGAAGAGDQVHDRLAAGFTVEGTFDRLDLAADAADAGEELLFFPDGVGHG